MHLKCLCRRSDIAKTALSTTRPTGILAGVDGTSRQHDRAWPQRTIGPHIRAHDGLGAEEIVRQPRQHGVKHARRSHFFPRIAPSLQFASTTDSFACCFLPRSKHYETELCSPRDGFSPAVRIELGENGGDVKLGGVEGDS
jgi:hypothetical protein